MGIGHLLLDAALAVVALWLTAELLLQNRAPVIWRAAALVGFLTVVAGMQLQSVLVIGVGAAAFALGQTFVTLSVKRGAVAGWSLRTADGGLPGPLARVPLLSAATGGTGAAAPAAPAPTVGVVGPIEPEEPGAGFDEVEEITADGVYTDDPLTAFHEDQLWAQQPQPGHQDAYGQQYTQQYAQQQYAQAQYGQYAQTGYGQYGQTGYAEAGYAQAPYDQTQYAQPSYAQSPSAQDQYTGHGQYQDPYAAQQQAYQQPADQQWIQQQAYQQPQPVVPQQAVHQQPAWDYQQQG
jgi:hypothetical protein